MKNGVLVFWIGLIVVGSAAYGAWVAFRGIHEQRGRNPAIKAQSTQTVPALETGPTIKDFHLTERSKLPFDSRDVDGQVWIASFFFSNCDKTCWQLNQVLRTIQDDIRDPDFRIVSITCDPEQDTPEVLQAYAGRLGADRGRWVFLTGDLPYIQRIGKEIFLQEVAPGFHMNRALLVDRQGNIRGSYDLLDKEKVAEMKAEISKLLNEPQSKSANKMEPHSHKVAEKE